MTFNYRSIDCLLEGYSCSHALPRPDTSSVPIPDFQMGNTLIRFCQNFLLYYFDLFFFKAYGPAKFYNLRTDFEVFLIFYLWQEKRNLSNSLFSWTYSLILSPQMVGRSPHKCTQTYIIYLKNICINC